MPQTLIAHDPFLAPLLGMGNHGTMDLHATVDVPGRLDAGQLRAALSCVGRFEPCLQGKPSVGWFRSAWVRRDDVSDDDWRVVEREVGSEEKSREEEEAFLDQAGFESRELPVEAALLHLPERDRLVLKVSHDLADGGGTKRLLYHLARCYRALSDDASWRPERRPPPPRHAWRLWRSLSPSRLTGLFMGLLDQLLSPTLMRYLFTPMEVSDGPPRRRVALLRIGRERLARLRERLPGYTVNDVLVAAYTRALASRFGDAPRQKNRVALFVSTDLRKFIPDEDRLCNLSSMKVLDFGALPLPEPAEHLRRVGEAFRRWKRRLTGLGFAVLLFPAAALTPAWIAHRLTVAFFGLGARMGACPQMLTNMGVIDEQRVDFGDGPCLEAWLVAPVARRPVLVAGASGCAGAVHLSVGYQESEVPAETIATLLETVDEELAALEAIDAGRS